MVELARQWIAEGVLCDAICETPKCLPDAVQLLTPYTMGNGWLKVIHLGHFSLSLYDKYESSGVRVFINPDELNKWSVSSPADGASFHLCGFTHRRAFPFESYKRN